MQQSKQRLDTQNKGMSTEAPSLVGFTSIHKHQIHLPWSWEHKQSIDISLVLSDYDVLILFCSCCMSNLFDSHHYLHREPLKLQIGGVLYHICYASPNVVLHSSFDITQLKIIKNTGKNVLNAEKFKYTQVNSGSSSLKCCGSWQQQLLKQCANV